MQQAALRHENSAYRNCRPATSYRFSPPIDLNQSAEIQVEAGSSPPDLTCSLRRFALARSRVERHVQCQSLLTGCSFGAFELAGDLGGRRLRLGKLLEFTDILRGPVPPFCFLDQRFPQMYAGATGAGQITATVTCRPSQAGFASSRFRVRSALISGNLSAQAAFAAGRPPSMARR
jgi:hypothetical protein